MLVIVDGTPVVEVGHDTQDPEAIDGIGADEEELELSL